MRQVRARRGNDLEVGAFMLEGKQQVLDDVVAGGRHTGRHGQFVAAAL